MHSATKVQLGTTQSSDRWPIQCYDSDPANFPAGKVVRVKSDGKLTLLKSEGSFAGISLGASLSDTKKTAVVRSGLRVPVLLDQENAQGTATITSYANLVSGTDDAITVGATVFTAQAGASTLGQATFTAATSNDATAASLAAQINAHAVAGALVTAVATAAAVLITAKAGGVAGNIVFTYTDNDTNVGATVTGAGTLTGGAAEYDHAVKGAYMYSSDTTGLATESGSGTTVTNAVYVSNALTGVKEDGTEAYAALVDMQGGL